MSKLLNLWWARQNSNLRPLPCQGRGPVESAVVAVPRVDSKGTEVSQNQANLYGLSQIEPARRAQDEAWGRTIGELDWLAEAALRGEA